MGKWERECNVVMKMGVNGNRGDGEMGTGMQCCNENGCEWE